MLRAGGQIHIPVPRLGKPPGAQHPAAAQGAQILLPGHGCQSRTLVGIVIEHLPIQTPGQLRAVEPVVMAFQCRAVFCHTLFQIQHGADQSGMVGIAKGIMGRPGGLDAEHLHGGFQRLLGGGAVGLGVENHLGIEPPLRPVLLQPEQPQVFPEDANIVEAPGEKHDVLAAPTAEQLDGLREGNALLPEFGLLDAGELTDPAVQMAVIFRLDHNLELVLNELLLVDPDGADLDDFPPDVHREHLLGGGRTRPGLIPFHIQYNIIHG